MVKRGNYKRIEKVQKVLGGRKSSEYHVFLFQTLMEIKKD
jgi:hypothetical protein